MAKKVNPRLFTPRLKTVVDCATTVATARRRRSLGRKLASLTLCSALANGALAAGEAPGTALKPILVTGKRASIATSLETKRDNLEIIDAVSAEDINKLPDSNVADAMQRITGVQITRDRGEASIVSIRGLGQIETTLNGREVFTAGNGRLLDFADFPAELLSAINVYKTASADQVEGGIGGTVDLRTRRPFDLEGLQLAGSARYIYGDLVKDGRPQVSGLASNRWRFADGGELGALVNFSYQERAWREDQKSVGTPIARNNIIPGQTVLARNGTTESASYGKRRRTAAGVVLQWRPSEQFELYAEGNYEELKTFQNTYQLTMTAPASFLAGSAQLFPGTSDLQSITWTNATAAIAAFARDTTDRNSQLAVGGKWDDGQRALKFDLSRANSYNNLYYAGPTLEATVARFSQDLSGNPSDTSVSGTNLADPANLRFLRFDYRSRAFNGNLTAFRLDGEQRLSTSFIDKLSAGVRLARRQADDGAGTIVGDADVPHKPLATSSPDLAGLLRANPAGTFFPGSNSYSDYLAGTLDGARDALAYRAKLGINGPLPNVAASPIGIWKIREQTDSAYVMANYHAGDLPIDGNIGVRVVRTREQIAGYQTVSGSGSFPPLTVDSSYTDTLPSANLRFEPWSGTVFRAALSKTVTRPDFNQLSPSLTLLRYPTTPSLNTGSAGNPHLRPVRSNNLDLAAEYYFSKTGAVHATLFAKEVDGFALSTSRQETWFGENYQITRPYNAGRADIQGVELGYQQFYDALPGWLRGLGVQANYTYVDSRTFDPVLRQNTALPNLSRHSVNLIGMYERGPVSARVAWNWRDRFLSRTINYTGIGALPVYTDAYGWLDASLSYRITPQITLNLEGLNLTRTVRKTYFGTHSRPEGAWINDSQIALSLAFKL